MENKVFDANMAHNRMLVKTVERTSDKKRHTKAGIFFACLSRSMVNREQSSWFLSLLTWVRTNLL
jgi:hypothetical protein